MLTKLSVVTILVRDQDEALRFYTEKLGMEKMDDIALGEDGRWLTVTAPEQKDLQIFLARADSGARDLTEHVGKAPVWAFASDNCRETYETLSARGVVFTSPPQEKPYGIEATFQDLYGNTFAIVQETAS